MRRRYRILFGLIACATVGTAAYFYVSYDPDAPRPDWPVLQAAKLSQQQVDVAVGPNVQVSPTDDTLTYWECVIAADARDPTRLVSAVIVRKPHPETDIVGFYSHDGGITWQEGCHQVCPKGHQFFDPTVAFGPDGIAYLAYMDTDPSTSTDKKDELWSTGNDNDVLILADKKLLSIAAVSMVWFVDYWSSVGEHVSIHKPRFC